MRKGGLRAAFFASGVEVTEAGTSGCSKPHDNVTLPLIVTASARMPAIQFKGKLIYGSTGEAVRQAALRNGES